MSRSKELTRTEAARLKYGILMARFQYEQDRVTREQLYFIHYSYSLMSSKDKLMNKGYLHEVLAHLRRVVRNLP